MAAAKMMRVTLGKSIAGTKADHRATARGLGLKWTNHTVDVVARVSSSRPSEPTSRPRSAFWNDSWKVRPIAITSPTDFICVVRRSFASGNFSKAKRGTLVTT